MENSNQIIQHIITPSEEHQIYDVLTQDISTTPPTFISHYHIDFRDYMDLLGLVS
tara:strand:+ start:5622 stop:5786 length:165 start_codon:yes stop_codon:yes gene_type:complete